MHVMYTRYLFHVKKKKVCQEEVKCVRRRELSLSRRKEVCSEEEKFVIVKKKRIASKEIEKFGKKCKRSLRQELERSLLRRRKVCHEEEKFVKMKRRLSQS